MEPVSLALLVGLGALAASRIGKPKRGTVPAAAGRVLALPNVGAEQIDPEIRRRLEVLADRVAPLTITITSGRRDPRRQAAAMIAKVKRGEDLAKLYRGAAADGRLSRLLALPLDPEAWAAEIDAQARAGRPISLHLTQRAADLRSRDWTRAELDRVVAEARRLGFSAVIESDHLHLQG